MRKIHILLLSGIVIGLALLLTQKMWVGRSVQAYILWGDRSNELMSRVPMPRALSTDPVLTGNSYRYKNITITLPWTKVSGKAEGESLAIHFEKNKHYFGIYQANSAGQELMSFNADLRTYYATRPHTDFNIVTDIANLTPKNISLFSSMSELDAKAALLNVKSAIFPYQSGPIYSFETKSGMRGFQFTPSATTSVAVVFTPKDERYVLFLVGVSPQETDSVLNSIRLSAQ